MFVVSSNVDVSDGSSFAGMFKALFESPVFLVFFIPSLQDLEEFVNGSEDDGFIVFTLGSMVENIPEEKAKEFFAAFGQIPQRVTDDSIASLHDCFLLAAAR